MKRKLLHLCLLFIWFTVTAYAQVPNSSAQNETDTAFINKLLQQSKDSLNESPEKAIALAVQARGLAEKADFKQGNANALKFIGLGYYYQGKYIETLDYWNQSLKIFDSLKDQI